MHRFRFILQNVCLVPLKLFFIIFADARARGLNNLKNLPYGRGVIIASNHKSQADAMLLPASLSFFSKLLPIYYVAIEAEYYRGIPWAKYLYGGFLFWLLGGIVFKKGLKNYALSLTAYEKILNEGKTICIFPEGKRIFESGLGEAHGGVGYLADVTNATIIPTAIVGNQELDLFDLLTFRRRLKVVFGKQATFEELYAEISKDGKELSNSRTTYKLVAQKIMDRVANLLAEESPVAIVKQYLTPTVPIGAKNSPPVGVKLNI